MSKISTQSASVKDDENKNSRTPTQFELVAGKTREELILATAPHIDPNSPRLNEDREKIERIALAEAAREALSERPFDDFDWANDPSVVLHEQRATAIYRNKRGDLVVRQERAWDEEYDPFFVVSQSNFDAFLDRMCDVLGIPSAGGPAR